MDSDSSVPAKASAILIMAVGKPPRLTHREFLYVDDMGLHVMAMDRATYAANTRPMLSHINVGTGEDLTIAGLALAYRDFLANERR